MPKRLRNRLTFMLERLIQRGALYQLLVMVSLVVLVAVAGGLLAWALTDAFTDPGLAIWWAFLRLTDPGYLGDDEGTLLRIISTVVTVLGYVLFMGSLIAILTQWLNQTMRKLESGLTPISVNGHILIIGWTNRTPTLVRELVQAAGRVQRFLRRRGTRRLRIVILADAVEAGLRQELRDLLGPSLRRGQIIFRSGSSMRIEHLRRVDFTNAAAILLPGADFALGGSEATDTRIIKTLMSISKYGPRPDDPDAPAVVAEIFDAQKIPIARQAFQGTISLIAGDAFVSRLIAQTVRHRGLSFIYSELLSYAKGNEVYVRSCPELAGRAFHSLVDAFPRAILLGVVRPNESTFEPRLNPPPGFLLEAEDRLVLIAQSYERSAPAPGVPPSAPPPAPSAAAPEHAPLQAQRRLLFMGWSHKVFALLQEFGSYTNEHFAIDILSVVPAQERTARLARLDLDPERVRVRHLEADYTLEADLHDVNPSRYDNIVFLGSDWLETGEASDARTILGYVLLRAVLQPDEPLPEVLVELIDPGNARLFQHRPSEVIISPLILSHMLAHAALRRELTVVFEELFGPGGAEIFFRPASDYGLADRHAGFREVQRAAAARHEVALGIRRYRDMDQRDGGIVLNPPLTERWTFDARDEIVVLTTYD